MKPDRIFLTLPTTLGSDALRCVRENLDTLRFIPIGRPSNSRSVATNTTQEAALAQLFGSATTLRADKFSPETWINRVAREIAESQMQRRLQHVSVFFSPTGGFTPPHYDVDDVLVVQLRGSKTLRIATTPHTVDPKQDTLLENLGTGHIEQFELQRGSAVLIPRGHAHSTSATTGSLTLGVGLSH